MYVIFISVTNGMACADNPLGIGLLQIYHQDWGFYQILHFKPLELGIQFHLGYNTPLPFVLPLMIKAKEYGWLLLVLWTAMLGNQELVMLVPACCCIGFCESSTKPNSLDASIDRVCFLVN